MISSQCRKLVFNDSMVSSRYYLRDRLPVEKFLKMTRLLYLIQLCRICFSSKLIIQRRKQNTKNKIEKQLLKSLFTERFEGCMPAILRRMYSLIIIFGMVVSKLQKMSRPWKQHCIVLLNSERQFEKQLIHSSLLLLIGFSIKIVPVNFHKHSISKLQINLYRENRGIFDKNRLQIQDQFTYKKERICVLVIFSYYLSECCMFLLF